MTKKAKLSNGTRRIRNKNWSDTNARQKIHESFAFTFTFNVKRSTYRCCVVTSFRSNGTRRPSLCCCRCSHRTITEHSRNTWNTSKRPTRQRARRAVAKMPQRRFQSASDGVSLPIGASRRPQSVERRYGGGKEERQLQQGERQSGRERRGLRASLAMNEWMPTEKWAVSGSVRAKERARSRAWEGERANVRATTRAVPNAKTSPSFYVLCVT